MRLALTGVPMLPTRLCEAKDRRAGVLCTTLPTAVQDCGLCTREDLGVAPPGGSPAENLGTLNWSVGVAVTLVLEVRQEPRPLAPPVACICEDGAISK